MDMGDVDRENWIYSRIDKEARKIRKWKKKIRS